MAEEVTYQPSSEERRQFGISAYKNCTVITGGKGNHQNRKAEKKELRYNLYYGSKIVVSNQPYAVCIAKRNSMTANEYASPRNFNIKPYGG